MRVDFPMEGSRSPTRWTENGGMGLAGSSPPTVSAMPLAPAVVAEISRSCRNPPPPLHDGAAGVLRRFARRSVLRIPPPRVRRWDGPAHSVSKTSRDVRPSTDSPGGVGIRAVLRGRATGSGSSSVISRPWAEVADRLVFPAFSGELHLGLDLSCVRRPDSMLWRLDAIFDRPRSGSRRSDVGHRRCARPAAGSRTDVIERGATTGFATSLVL